MKRNLQFTLFAKILALTSSVMFGALFYFHAYITELFDTYSIGFEVKASLFWMLYFTAGVIVIGLSISSYLITLSVATPIRKLVDLTEQISAGNFELSTDSLYPLSSDEIGELSQHFISMTHELHKRQKVHGLLQKLHGQEITDEFLKGALDNQAILKNITVMFIDIRGFTKFAENKSPVNVLENLNTFFEQCGDVVSRNGGVIDKFMGDSLMAVWGVLDEGNLQESNNQKALRCAMEINSLKLDFDIGIGLHCGKAILGSVGTKIQRDYTVIGDTVNTAARLQQATRTYGTNLVVSLDVVQDTLGAYTEFFQSKTMFLQGKQKSVEVYIFNETLRAA